MKTPITAEDPEKPEDAMDAELRERLSALPLSIEPERDLWPLVEGRIRPARRHVWMERLAAGLLLAVAAVLLLRLSGGDGSSPRGDETPAVSTAASNPPSALESMPSAASPMLRSAYAETDSALVSIRDELRRVVDEQMQGLAPETRQVVVDNLRTIELAIAEIEAALAAEPAGPQRGDLARTYIAYRQRQIDLLRQVNRAASRL